MDQPPAPSSPNPAQPSRVWAALQIRPEETGRTLILFAYLFSASVVFTTARTARDALFLNEFPLSWLPWLMVAFGVGSALIAPFYSPLADRFRRDRFNAAFAAGLAVSYLAAWLLIWLKWRPIYPILYVWVEITNNFLIVQFWTLANDLHDAREAKRLFGVIGSGRMLGILFCGIAVSLVVRQIGTASLLLVNAAVLALMAVLVTRIGRRYFRTEGVARVVSAGGGTQDAGTAQALKSRYVLWIIGMIACTYVAATIGDYQFKAIARTNYSGERLAAFFALFYGLTGAAAFMFQFFVSARLLALFGLAAGLLVMPLLMGLSNIALLLTGGALMAAAAIKFSDNAFQFTINDSSLQMLYYPFANSVKTRLKALLEGAVKPVGYGIGGLVLIAAAQWLGPVRLAWAVLPVIGVWVFAVMILRQLYLDALVQSLSHRQFEAGEIDLAPSPQVIGALSEAVRTGNHDRATYAMNTLKEIDPAAAARLATELLASPLHRSFALSHLHSLPADPATVAPYLDDPDLLVRREAIRAWSVLTHEEGIEKIAPHLKAADFTESDTACAALIHNGGLDGVLFAADHLRHLLNGSDSERARAAAILGEARVRAFARPLQRLITDPSPVVRHAAAEAAGHVKSRKLLKPLLHMLTDWHLRGVAIQALEAYRERALEVLSAALGDETLPIEIRLRLPRLIRRIHHPDAVHALWAHARTPHDRLRAQVLHHAARLNESWDISLDRGEIQACLENEKQAAAKWLGRWADLRPLLSDPLLTEAVGTELMWCGRRIFSLLRVMYPPDAVSRIRLGVESADRARRATALETLDNLLARHEREWIVPLIDTSDPSQAATRLLTAPAHRTVPATDSLASLVPDLNPYLSAVLIRVLLRTKQVTPGAVPAESLGAWTEMALEELYAASLRSGSGLVSVEALARQNAYPRLERLIETHHRQTEDHLMLTTLERVLFLKGVPLFSHVPGEDLAGLAQESSVAEFKANEDVFREGDPGDALYLVVKGHVRVHAGGSALATLGEGECFGEMAILDNAPRSATVTATESLVTLKITREDFFEILSDRPEIARSVFAVLTARLRKADAEIRRLSAA